MEKRGDDGIDWLMMKNSNVSSSPSPEKPIRNLPIPHENHHHQPNGVSPAVLSMPRNHLSRLSSSAAGNHPLQLSQPEINPYHSNLDQFRNNGLLNNGVHVNPSFPETLYDPLIDFDFSSLRLSSPHHQSPFMANTGLGGGSVNGGGSTFGHNSLADSSIGMGLPPISYSQTQYPNMDLQRMRVQSAVRGQIGGMYMPQQGFSSIIGDESLEDFGIHSLNLNNDFDFDNIYNGGRSLVTAAMNRCERPRAIRNGFLSPYEPNYGAPIMSNRNGFRLGNNTQCQARSINGFGSENSSVLLSSLYNNNLYRSRQRQNFTSLEDLKGRMFLVAKDQHGCRFLQKKFEDGKPEDIEMIFSEVKDHVPDLMIDQFGNYLIQKFFEVCNEDQMTQILLSVISDENNLMEICLDMHGTRAMQKLLEYLTTPEQRSLVISVLRCITVTLTKSMNGHHVIQHCLKFFSVEDTKHILNVVADNCLDIATDKSGCCVLQQCVAHAQGEPKERLVAEITANALVLSEHPYGNYVVQYIIGMRIAHVTADILAQLMGSYVSLAMNKYGSNVVEKCLRESEEDQAMEIIKEIVASPNFLMVLQDPYGNYVAQSALAISKGSVRHTMVELIQIHYPFLHSHPHGKRVLAQTRGSNKQRVCISM